MRILANFGTGGAGLTPFSPDNLAVALRGLVHDLLLRNGLVLTPAAAMAVIATADATAPTGSYVEATVDSIGTLATALKAKINSLNTGAITSADAADQGAAYVQADMNTISALLNEIATKLTAANADCGVPVVSATTCGATYSQQEVASLCAAANAAKAYVNAFLSEGFTSSL